MKTNTNNIIKKSISLLLAIVTLSTIALFYGCGKSNKAQVKLEDLAIVPNVIGMQKEEAIKTLEEAGLVADYYENLTAYDKKDIEKHPENIINSQHYDANIVLKKGTSVRISSPKYVTY